MIISTYIDDIGAEEDMLDSLAVQAIPEDLIQIIWSYSVHSLIT